MMTSCFSHASEHRKLDLVKMGTSKNACRTHPMSLFIILLTGHGAGWSDDTLSTQCNIWICGGMTPKSTPIRHPRKTHPKYLEGSDGRLAHELSHVSQSCSWSSN